MAFDFAWDLEQQKVALIEQQTKASEAFFEQRADAEEQSHKAMVMAIETHHQEHMADFARLHGISPQQVVVSQSVNGVDNEPIYDVKP